MLAALVMVIATPLGTALALGMRRWRGPGAGAANVVLLLPLVTPELVFAVGMFLLFTTAFGFIGLGTTAQAIGQVTFTLSWVVLIVRGRLATIGREVEEAAADLGAPPLHVVGRVLLPLLAAGHGGEPAGLLRAVDRRLRRQPVPGARAPTPRRCRCASTRRRAAARRRRSTRWRRIMLVVSLLALVFAYARVPEP